MLQKAMFPLLIVILGRLIPPIHSRRIDRRYRSLEYWSLPRFSLCTWTLTESIQRASSIAHGLQGAYLMVQQGRTDSCHGSKVFASQQGLEEAQSASAWVKLYWKMNILSTRLNETDRLLS